MESDYHSQDDDNHIVEGSLFDYRSPADQPPYNSPLGRFSRLSQQAEEEIDLAEAAMIIAAQEYSGLDEIYYLNKLDDLADEVRPLLTTETDPLKAIEKLNYFLSQVKGFHGNESDYENRRNSYFNDVLERRTGLPITLSLLYIELGKRLGLHFEGIGLPGHFIIRYRELAPQASSRNDYSSSGSDNLNRQEESEHLGLSRQDDILLDPFNGGQVLTEEDCIEMVRQRYGRLVGLRQAFMRPVSNRQFLSRMLNNLKASCIGEEDYERALDFQEFLVALNPDSAEEKRDRGELYLRNERFGRAAVDLKAYLRENGNAQDAHVIRAHLKLAMDEVVKRN